MGLIAVEGLQFYAHHGYYKEEQVLGGKYTVDIYMEVNFTEAATADDLKKTIDYEKVYILTKQEMSIHSKLIEHVCNRIAHSIKNQFTEIEKLKVRLSKYNPPLKGNVERVFVEIEL
jgi:dihydroneopterin aldolase